MTPEELTAKLAGSALQDAALVYFDGRLTEAALVLAAAARQRGVPVLVEAERLRPGLEQLLGMADFVVSSTHFPQEWTGEELLGDALVATFGCVPCGAARPKAAAEHGLSAYPTWFFNVWC
jgi:hypothetical protein